MKRILVKRQMKFIILPLFIISSLQLSAQVLQESICPSPKENSLSKFIIESYISSSNHKNKRISSGTDNVSLTEVSAVDNETVCSRLENIIQSNPKYKQVDGITELRKFFYTSNDFYFIFWNSKNEVGFGPKRLFLVIKKDYSKIYEFYL